MSLERCGKHRIPIVVKIRSLIVVWCTLAVHGFPSSWRLDSTRASKALFSGANEPVLFYSPNFHRHVIAEFDGQKVLRVIESFLFLDDAEQHYPDARRVLTTHSSKLEMIAGLGMEGRETYLESLEKVTDRLIPATLVSNQHDILADRLSGVCNMLTCKIGSPFLNFFPSDEHDLIYERIQFLLSPLPEVKKDMDWPKSFCDGYGAGLTDEQVVSAILGLRHLLPANPTIALKEKPPITYFISALGITVDGLNEVRGTLSGFLDGECAVDVGTFSHLRALGISWDQCNVLLQSFAATILSCELERTWDLFDGPGLNPLPESSINYLRERFQLYPAEVCCMLRTHSRLSTYSVKILKSHSDALQCQFGLSSRALRQLILRSPSVLGVAEVKVATRASFFRDRCK